MGTSMESIDAKSALAKEPITLTGDSAFVCAGLISRAVTAAIYDDKLRSFGISSTQFALLRTIYGKSISRAQIARLHHLNKSTLTRDLKAVLSAGWIQEVREGANGRMRPIALTALGEELMLNAQQAWASGPSSG